MMKNFEKKIFEDCIEKIIYTTKIKRKNFLEAGQFPIISQEQEFINGYWNDPKDVFKIKKPVVVFGDHTQVVKYIDFNFVLGADGVKILQPTNDLNPKYFYYCITIANIKTLGYARHYRLLKEIQFPIPPLPEQKRIVKILDEVFEKVTKAKENAEKNLQNARELFESYLQGVFANPSTSLGTGPGEDWEEKALGEVCGFVRGPFGGSLKKSIFKKNGYAVYEQQHAIYDQFDDIRYFIDDNKFNEMKRFELNSGELIMSCSGTMGKMAVVPKNIKRGIINQALLKLTPSKEISIMFLKLWMQSENFQDSLKKYSQGAAIKNVASVKILKKIKMPVPTISEQHAIVSKLNELSAETKKLEAMYQQKIANLEELKKSALQKAFKGES